MERYTLYKIFKGVSTDSELKEVRSWMEEHPDNYKKYIQERQLYDVLQFSDRVLFSEKKKSQKIPFFLLRIAVLLIIFSLGYLSKQSLIREDKSQIAMNTITVPAGQSVSLTLSDNTRVWLNARTTLSYPSSFEENRREVYLDGEAFFTVNKMGEGNRFIVHTNQCDIEVLGTEFNVEAYKDLDVFTTALMTGSVQIIKKNKPDNPILLTPNNMISVVNGEQEIKPINDLDLYRWKEGLLCFKNTQFDQLIKRLERCYDVRIEIQNKRVKNQVFGGKFRISDGLDIILRVLQTDADFQIIRESNESYIIK